LRDLDGNLMKEQQFDTLFRRNDGTIYPVALRILFSHGKDGVVGVLLAQDITDRQQQLEKLRAYAQRLESSNRELQDFAFVASHDLQEPLRKVRAFGDRLKANESEHLTERGIDYINRMQNAAERMQTLINDLLKLSRVTTKARPFVPVELTNVAYEVVDDLEARINEVGGCVEIGTLPVVQADALQMRQLLQNLIGNALKFRRADEAPQVRLFSELIDTTTDAPARYRITVEDNGIGFDKQYAERIFTPFERLHSRQEYEGTGMGLALCKKIVERHGGTIAASGRPGTGSSFSITLPATTGV
jgi:light-regulated signal transduction histidine kinase (bacteriophytochrome)